jgi:tetratricopeptide (TPR) repeat protein
MAHALNTKGILLSSGGRTTEGLALIRNALDIALKHDKPYAALRAYYNLADVTVQVDRASESADLVAEALALARKVGNRYWEWVFLGFAHPLYLLGDWDEVVAREEGLPHDDWTQVRIAFTTLLTSIVPTRVHRGELERARDQWRFFAELETSADVQERAQGRVAAAAFCFAEKRYDEALRSAQLALEIRDSLGIASEGAREAFVLAVEAALALDDDARAEELLTLVDSLPVGHSPKFLRAHSARFHANLAARRGNNEDADRQFGCATRLFRELTYPFCLAVTLLEHGEWLAGQGRHETSELMLSEAGSIFQRLRARPWLERVARVSSVETTP